MCNFHYRDLEEFRGRSYKMLHKCKCGGVYEINEIHARIIIDGIDLRFLDLHVLVCLECGNIQIPPKSSQLIETAFNMTIKHGASQGEFSRKSYRESFDYCKKFGFHYDAYDYYNIPGLCHDMEHDIKGFLTPVYFTKKVLQQFMLDENYRVNLFSETYGAFSKTDEWVVPFGINCNGNVVFWLGDLSDVDELTLSMMKPHNIESDHKIISSEFYAAQMSCIWSKPNYERRVYELRNKFYNIVMAKANLSLYHLQDEIKYEIENYDKPILVNEKTILRPVAILHQIVIEGIELETMRQLCATLQKVPVKTYEKMMSIKLYETLLRIIIKSEDQIRDIVSPLYLLNDLRICFDHLLSQQEREKKQQNVVDSLGLSSFEQAADIYSALLSRLIQFFEYIIIGYESFDFSAFSNVSL